MGFRLVLALSHFYTGHVLSISLIMHKKLIHSQYYYRAKLIILRMMPSKICLRVPCGSHSQLKNKGEGGPASPNLFIYLNDRLVLAEREKLSECKYIAESCGKHQKILLIQEDLDSTMFAKVINYFHGGDLELATMKDLAACINILDYLQARKLICRIEEKIEQEIQAYDIFCLLEISFSYGLQKVFDLCLRYLEFDQFEQIKYNKFSLMECNFKLFQAILRRHHVLKMKGQIEGLDPPDIEEVIHTYCRMHKIDHETQQKLLDKYLANLEKFERVKTSLRLDKLARKNILQSANIDTDFYETDHVIRLVELEHIPTSVIKHEVRKRKYSEQIMKDILLVKEMKFSNNQTPISNLFDGSVEEPQQAQTQMSHYQVKIKGAEIEHIPNEDRVRELLELGQPKREGLGLIVSKISEMRNEYEEALQEHNEKYRSMRRNSKSQFLQQFSSDLISKARLLSSSNLKQSEALFKMFAVDQ